MRRRRAKDDEQITALRLVFLQTFYACMCIYEELNNCASIRRNCWPYARVAYRTERKQRESALGTGSFKSKSKSTFVLEATATIESRWVDA